MNKKIAFFSLLLTLGIVFMVSFAIDPRPQLMSSGQQMNGVHEISFALQATDQPPVVPTIAIPTIVINPPPGGSSNGFLGQITPLTILLFVLVVGIILIALIAVLRKPSA